MTLPSLPMATLRERVIEQKFRVLAGQLRFAMSGNVIAAFALAVLIWDKADQTVISTWLLIIIAASGLRFFIHHKISQASRRGQSLSSWGPYLTAVMTANGFAWGGLSFTFMQPQANFLIASTLSVTIGVIAGALGSLAIYRPAFWGFTMAALAPIIVRFFWFGVIEFTIAGILLIIFGGI